MALWAAVMAALTALVCTRPARAQALRPNVLIIFDTSGSMLSLSRDGSPLCGNLGQDSRFFLLKDAIKQTLAQVGTDEINVGLARFPQKEDLNLAASCPEGWAFQDDSTRVEGRKGCKISSHTEEATYGPWFDEQLRQVLLVDVTAQRQSGKPVANDFDPPGGNVAAVHRYLDLQETSVDSDGAGGAPPVVTNPELRTDDGWYTPLGRSLFYARMYFENYVKPADPRGACRQNLIIFVTDGDESCDELPPTGWNDTTCTGTTPGDSFHPRVQACALRKQSNVRTFVLTDTGTGPANDDIAKAGGTGNAIRVNLTDSASVKAALVGIIAETVPPAEICDGADNDCDGQTDEGPLPGVGERCGCAGLTDAMDGVGQCMRGTTVCNGIGVVCQGCVGPRQEICNGSDDNCNNLVDEGYDIGNLCQNGQRGVCYRVGNTRCSIDGTTTECDVQTVVGTFEVCNALDDDCDGRTDERDPGTFLPGENQACGINIGICEAGKTVCAAGKLFCDQPKATGVAEICNRADDDCDGSTDENLGGEICGCRPYSVTLLSTGECRPGTLVCNGKNPLDCAGCVGPSKEVCDSKDNDCDGLTDEASKLCEGERFCREGACVPRCQPVQTGGEFQMPPCAAGFECAVDANPPYCRSTRCRTVVCGAGFVCDEADGTCKDPCTQITCAEGLSCLAGQCVDCYTAGCPDGQRCRAGRCVVNPCADAATRCQAGEFCAADGACTAICPMTCPAGLRCLGGQCVDDTCAGVTCDPGTVCSPARGECVSELCPLRQCPGQVCVRTTGQCQDDPCAVMACPSNGCFDCQVTVDGQGVCVERPSCREQTIKTTIKAVGGGGCGMGGRGAPAPGVPWVLLLAGLGALGRRGLRRTGRLSR